MTLSPEQQRYVDHIDAGGNARGGEPVDLHLSGPVEIVVDPMTAEDLTALRRLDAAGQPIPPGVVSRLVDEIERLRRVS
jgi:hypothetical protein